MIKSVLASKAFRSGVRLLISIGLLVILLRMTSLEDVLLALGKANILYIVAAFFLLSFNLGFQILKWNYLLGRTEKYVPFRDVLASFFFGVTLGSFTPGQIGEFGGRTLNLKTQEPGVVVGLTILDKSQMFAVMVITGLFSIIHLMRVDFLIVFIATSAASASTIIIMLRPGLLRLLFESIGAARLKHPWARQALESLSLLSTRDLAATMVLTLLFYMTAYLQLLFLFGAFSFFVPLQVFFGFSAMMLVKSLLPISIADLGTREIGLVYFMSIQGIPRHVSFDASILLFSINILIPAIAGLIFLPKGISIFRSLQNE